MPSSRGSSQASHIARGFFTVWVTRKALISYTPEQNKKWKTSKQNYTMEDYTIFNIMYTNSEPILAVYV